MSPPPAASVSVIVPVFNGERFLRDALSSVAAQTLAPLETIVVDDGSTDGGAAIAQGLATCLRQANEGVAAARNHGAASARGELLAFLDQDDTWLPEKLAAQVAFLGEHPELGFCVCLQRYVVEPGQPPPAFMRKSLLESEHPGYVPSALLVRREAFEQVGPFNPAFRFGSDADWFLRAAEAGVAGGVVPCCLLRKRVHGANESRHAAENLAELRRAVKASLARKRQASS